jgi:hypothetical protein
MDCLNKRYVFSGNYTGSPLPPGKISRHKKISMVIAIYVFLTTFRYLHQATIPLNASSFKKALYGTLFHGMGYGGKVLLPLASAVIIQAGIFRIVFWIKEYQRKVRFLEDFVNFRSDTLISRKGKYDFGETVHAYYRYSYFLAMTSHYVACTFTVILGVYLAFQDLSFWTCIVWIFWVCLQCIISYFAWPDIILLGGFWFVMRTYVKLTVTQISSELEILTHKVVSLGSTRCDDERLDRYIKIWHLRYRKMVQTLSNFNDFSRSFLLIVTAVSSVSCATFIFGFLKTEDVIIISLLTPLLLSYTGNSVTLLYGATVIHSKGKRLYITLNRSAVALQPRLSLRQKFAFKNLIYETGNKITPSVTLITKAGEPYDQLSFAEFVGSFATLLIMMYDFLYQFFK